MALAKERAMRCWRGYRTSASGEWPCALPSLLSLVRLILRAMAPYPPQEIVLRSLPKQSTSYGREATPDPSLLDLSIEQVFCRSEKMA